MISLSLLPTAHPGHSQVPSVRSSTRFYSGFNLAMGRSPPLRVLCEQLCALFRLAFAAPPGRRALRLAAHINSQTHYAKGTPSPHEGASTACKQQVSGTFHSPNRGAFHLSLAVLFTIGRQPYLALRSGLRDFTPGFTCPVLLRVPLDPT